MPFDVGPAVPLAGGVGNGGRVVRVGDTVRRPATRHSAVMRRVAVHLEAVGFDRAPRYLGTDDLGRDVYTFVPGDVPLPPFPPWARDVRILAEVATLLRDFHAAMADFEHGDDWSAELADPAGGPTFCHDDVCPENVVFRAGRAVALLDFDYAAPGRRVWDVARTARLWVPVRAPAVAGRTWGPGLDVPGRLAVFTQAYGLDADEREALVETLLTAVRHGQAWVRGKVDAGEPAFVAMWQEHAMATTFDVDLAWLRANRGALARAVAGDVRKP